MSGEVVYQELPNNREAEEAVIGSVLINPDAFVDAAQHISAADFYIHRHGWIWEAFTSLFEKRAPIDLVTISDELSARGRLQEVGGPAYLTGLLNDVPTSLHAEAYARIVKEAALRRRMLSAANDLAKMAFDRNQPYEAILKGFQDTIFKVSGNETGEFETIEQVVSDVYDAAEERANNEGGPVGVPTGLIDLDRLLGGGLQDSDLILIAGRPGTGKTGCLLSMGLHSAKEAGKRVGIFSLEMSNEQLVQRLIAQETGIDTNTLRTGRLSDGDWPLFTQAIETLAGLPIYLDDTPAITPVQMRSRCRRIQMMYGLDLVILDYLQLMSGGNRFESRVQEVSYISRSLKVLAKELNVPVLAAAQLSRAVELRADKIPQLSDLRESGSQEQDADVIMFIHSPDARDDENNQDARLAKLLVAKHRNGPPAPKGIDMIFLKKLAKFTNAAIARQSGR